MRTTLTALTFLTLMLCSSVMVVAEVPDSISFQGILVDAEGHPVTETVPVYFAIYDDSTRGMPLWSETQEVTPNDQGLFNVLLGGGELGETDSLGADIFAGPNRWLEYSIEGTALLPRIAFTVVPYAYRVQTVDGSTGGEIEGDVTVTGELSVTSVMFSDGTSQTTATNMPTQNLWSISGLAHPGGCFFVNNTGGMIYVTSIWAEAHLSEIAGASVVIGTMPIYMRMGPNESRLWTGGGVPMPLAPGQQISMHSNVNQRITVVGFTE